MMNGFKRITTLSVSVSMMISPLVSVLVSASPVVASSHREAPLISQDAQADATDLYAFVSPDKPDTVTLIANYLPMQLPPAGPNFYKFGDEVLYEINIDNNGDAKDDLSLQFKFWSEVKNGNTFLYNTGPITALNSPNLNQKQYYSVSLLRGEENRNAVRKGKVVKGAEKLMVAPANVGPKSYPEGYGKVAAQAVYNVGEGIKVFAGPRDDPFFVDLGGIFDLLSGISGKDYVAGANVMTLAVQVPKSFLTANKKDATDPKDTNSIVGVRTTSYRKTASVLREENGKAMSKTSGNWVQVSRLDNPLVNEVVIPLKDKDKWNSSLPKNDGQFLSYVTKPELGGLMKAILGVNTPPAPRNDLVTIFLTGIPGLNQPAKVVASSQLRLNMAIPPTAEPKKNGVLAGDNAGYPNGRRLADDVTDIALQAVAGGTPFTPDFNKEPNNVIGDKVDANDKAFMGAFPYVAEPNGYAAQ